jgi:hypothetical protein
MYRDSVTLAIHSFRYDNVQRTVLLPLQRKPNRPKGRRQWITIAEWINAAQKPLVTKS